MDLFSKNISLKIVGCFWLLFILIIIFFVDHHRTVSFNYWSAANLWLNQQPLYQSNGKGFIYLIQSAVLYIPLVKLPFTWSEGVWRMISISIFAWGFYRFIFLCVDIYSCQNYLPFFCLLLSPMAFLLCFDSARNGQMHLLTTGLMLLATAGIFEKKWRTVTFLLVLSFFLKPTALVFLLLIAGLFFTETWWYFLLWGSLFILLPFITQNHEYVITQYKAIFSTFKIVLNTGRPQHWAEFFNLISQFGWEIPQFWQMFLRINVALLFLLLGYIIKKRCTLLQTAVWLLMLSMVYLVLFNPRTENNDYMILIPVLSYAIIKAFINKKFFHLAFLCLIIVGLTCSYYISHLFYGHRNWGAPLMAVLVLAHLLYIFPTKSYRGGRGIVYKNDLFNNFI